MRHLTLYESYDNTLVFYDESPERGVRVQGSYDSSTHVAKLGYIKSPYKGSGLGSKYLQEFEQWAKEQGAIRVEINAYKTSLKFWEKMGYTLEPEFPVFNGVKQDYKDGYKELKHVNENRSKYMIDLELKRRATARKEAAEQEIDDIDLSDDEIKEILIAVKHKKYDVMSNVDKLKKLQKLRLVKAPGAIQTASSFSFPFYLTDKGAKLISA